ncbi:MAG: type II CRISPR-associated endonuclease Cas1 [Negativicutes bacterium]
MSWRSVMISNPAQLNIKNRQLVITQDDLVGLPLEDIAVIVADTPEISLSARLLSELAATDTALVVCDEKHLPSGIFLPYNSHSRQSKVLKMQVELSEPFKKRCWQKVVQCKIDNQARALELLQLNRAKELRSIAERVVSGDKDNCEAVAANSYFREMFPYMTRDDGTIINAGLNYGYAIIRTAVARGLTAYGFHPALGIFHRSELNNFNLADDFIEPFRPLVDMWVHSNLYEVEVFGKLQRAGLVQLLHYDVFLKNGCRSVLNAVDVMMASFAAACRDRDVALLELPTLVPLQLHSYE